MYKSLWYEMLDEIEKEIFRLSYGTDNYGYNQFALVTLLEFKNKLLSLENEIINQYLKEAGY